MTQYFLSGRRFNTEINTDRMKRKKRYILATALACCLLTGCSDKTEEVTGPEAGILLEQVQSVEKLTLAQMRITKMATIDDIKLEDAKGMKQVTAALIDALKIGDRKGAYSYDTYMSAYMDLSEMNSDDIRVDNDTRTIRLHLPAVRLEFSGRDAAIREDHYRVTGLRSAISAQERAALKEKMNSHLKEEVRKNPEFGRMLEDNARRRAEGYFKELLSGQGYRVEIEIES